PRQWEGSEAGSPSAPRAGASDSELRGLPDEDAHEDFDPLDDSRLSRSLDELIARRSAFLADYQNAAWARRYAKLVGRVRSAENLKAPGSTALTEAVARNLAKLMAYKDEYEVARLYASGPFIERLRAQFEGDFSLRFHLAPPLLAKKDAHGRPIKREYGPWMFTAFGWLARLKFLRGTAFDPFGRTDERREERKLIADYETVLDELLAGLDDSRLRLAVDIASLPEHIRGYGHVKHAHVQAARRRGDELLARWRNPKVLDIVQVD
ncbi:MAG TPA: indolepyruvate ferredoxin oxidoreductase family protein, partial [Xanthomonadaceae bacterium]|nr:indolepyruvate ferredoxin oxidoreductase family protein [Xanthomonadaceae bacterium]